MQRCENVVNLSEQVLLPEERRVRRTKTSAAASAVAMAIGTRTGSA